MARDEGVLHRLIACFKWATVNTTL